MQGDEQAGVEVGCQSKTPSISIAIHFDDLRSRDFLNLVPVDAAQPAHKIGKNAGRGPLGNEAGDDFVVLGELEFFALAQKSFDPGEVVTQIADGYGSHVIHNSITIFLADYSLFIR